MQERCARLFVTLGDGGTTELASACALSFLSM